METNKIKSLTNLLNNRAFLIGGILTIIVIGIVFLMMIRGNNQANNTDITPTPVTQTIIPTVDSSVQVEVVSQQDSRKFDMTVRGIPNGTTSLEYEISYETEDGGIQGFNSPVEIDPGQDTYEKEGFLLGTCSTGGKCTYHTLAGPIKVTIKFVGSYGERLYENEFEL